MGVVLEISYLKLWTINKLEIKKKKKFKMEPLAKVVNSQ